MSLTVYITSDLDLDTVLGALNKHYAEVIEQWQETKTTTFKQKDGKEGSKTKTTYTAVLLVEEEAIAALRHYVRVQVHRNFYVRDGQDGSSLYVRLLPDQKLRADEIMRNFAAIVKGFQFKYEPKNGFGFYTFTMKEFVPVVAGMLRAYPEFEEATIKYALQRAPHSEGSRASSLPSHPKGTIIFNAPALSAELEHEQEKNKGKGKGKRQGK